MDDLEDNADELFADALLKRHYQNDPNIRSLQVESALERIRSEEWGRRRNETHAKNWTLRIGGFASAAAAIAVMIFALAWSSSSADAMAVLERSIDAMSVLSDQQYKFEVETELPDGVLRSEGQLFVRGTGELAIRAVFGDMEIWAGDDGNESWVVPPLPLLPVLTARAGNLVEMLVPNEGASLPLLRITSALQRLRDSHDLSVHDLSDELVEVSAQLRPGLKRDSWPTSIVFRAEPSGVVTTCVMHWEQYHIYGARSVRLELLGTAAMPDELYGHRAHHEGRTVVRRN